MSHNKPHLFHQSLFLICTLALSLIGCASGDDASQDAGAFNPTNFPKVGEVDARYQSYNVEMLEVTGGRFWKPYSSYENETLSAPSAGDDGTPAGMPEDLYEYRPPIDLYNARLRTLAKGLAPAFMRVSGTWSNTTYVPAPGETPPATPPEGYGGVLTPEQWKGAVEFSKAVDADIVTSFAIGSGVRNSGGVWTPVQAERLLDLTEESGGKIAAAEFFNEPNIAAMGGAPQGYTAEDYGRDFQIFQLYMRDNAPDMKIVGPGSVMESTGDWVPDRNAAGSQRGLAFLPTQELLAASGDAPLDAFSYHHYGALSRRCAAMGLQITPEFALSEDWFRRTDESLEANRMMRDEYAPGIPFWLTETADAACGGNPWGREFLDTFRYLDQLGRLAKQDVNVVMHNTLVASDYGLLDEETLTPKPNYWGALVWQRLMGTTVLESGVDIQEGMHLYAHCMVDTPGGVAMLLLNNSTTAAQSLDIPVGGERYTLSAEDVRSPDVELNGKVLQMTADDTLPDLTPVPFSAGHQTFAPTTITFLAMSEANNPVCL